MYRLRGDREQKPQKERSADTFLLPRMLSCMERSGRRQSTQKERGKPAPKAKKCEHVKIVVVRKIDLFPGFVPEVGKVYDAEKYKDAHYSMPGYVIVVNGHRVNVRYNECKEVAG